MSKKLRRVRRQPTKLNPFVTQQALVKLDPRNRPRTPRKKGEVGLPLRFMVSKTLSNVRIASTDVKLVKMRKFRMEDGIVRIESLTKTAKSKNLHQQYIETISPEDEIIANRNTLVRVTCDCSAYKFVNEVALFRYDSANVLYSNGKFPHTTNAQSRPMLCKHLYKLAKQIINQNI